MIKIMPSKDKKQPFYCQVVAGNGTIIAHTESHKTKKGAIKNARSIQKNCGVIVDWTVPGKTQIK